MEVTILNRGDFLVTQTNQGETLYQMSSVAALPTRKKYILTDNNGHIVGEIKRLRNNFGLYDLPRYDLNVHGKEKITVMKDMAQFHANYVVKGQDISLKGELLGDAFSVYIKEKKYADVQVNRQEDEMIFHLNIEDDSRNDLLIGFMYMLVLVYEDEHYVVRV